MLNFFSFFLSMLNLSIQVLKKKGMIPMVKLGNTDGFWMNSPLKLTKFYCFSEVILRSHSENVFERHTVFSK